MLKRLKNALGSGNDGWKCAQDPETGILHCKSHRQHKDGTTTELAHLEAQQGADCKPVITELGESEEGAYNKLEANVIKKLTSKCKNTPSDY